MNDKIKKKIKKILAIIGLIVIVVLFVLMVISTFQGNGNMVMASLISIIFVSILFYIALYLVKK